MFTIRMRGFLSGYDPHSACLWRCRTIVRYCAQSVKVYPAVVADMVLQMASRVIDRILQCRTTLELENN